VHSSNGNKETDKVITGVLSGLIFALIVSVGVSLIVMFKRRVRRSKKLMLSPETIISTTSNTGNVSSQQDGSDKDTLSQPVDKMHCVPEILGSKPTSVHKSLSLTGGTNCDNKSEKFISYLDPDRESIKSPIPCSDITTTLPPTPESRIGPDGTDRYMN